MSIPHSFDPLGIGSWRPALGMGVAANVDVAAVMQYDVVEIKADFSSAANYAIIRFAANRGSNPSYIGVQYMGANLIRYFNDSHISSVSPFFPFDKTKESIFVLDHVGVWLNGALVWEQARTYGAMRMPVLVTSVTVKLWYIKHTRNGVDIARYVPYTNGKEIKLYDEVSKKFLA